MKIWALSKFMVINLPKMKHNNIPVLDSKYILLKFIFPDYAK